MGSLQHPTCLLLRVHQISGTSFPQTWDAQTQDTRRHLFFYWELKEAAVLFHFPPRLLQRYADLLF